LLRIELIGGDYCFNDSLQRVREFSTFCVRYDSQIGFYVSENVSKAKRAHLTTFDRDLVRTLGGSQRTDDFGNVTSFSNYFRAKTGSKNGGTAGKASAIIVNQASATRTSLGIIRPRPQEFSHATVGTAVIRILRRKKSIP
jgi:hypothetical protein